MLSTKFIYFTILIELCASDVRVNFPLGSLVGSERQTVSGVTYYLYRGIPYAEPPIGPRRFQAPVEKKPWNTVLDATEEGNICYQVYDDFDNENEDCLFLNIYTPVNPSSNKTLPVLFWIYGGGFLSGYVTDLQFGADHLIAKDVIVVECNYRIGPFGFLSTGDAVIPGNAGLKDQRLALEWTQKYIRYFGGDPTKVTIYGQSAGCASVSYHLLSPSSKGLFRAAICQSASALSPWAYNRNMTKMSYDMSKLIDPKEFGEHNATSKDLLHYLQGLPAKKIDDASAKLWYPQYLQIQHGFYFAPVIEVENDGAFITERQYELLKEGKINNVPIMMGFTSEESIIMMTDKNFDLNVHDFEDDHHSLIPLDLNEKVELRDHIATVIYQRYAKNQTFIENKRNAVKYLTDQCFARSIRKHANLQSKYGNVWFYRFAYKGMMGGVSDISVPGFSTDVGHGEDLSYIFAYRYKDKNGTDPSIYPKSDVLVHDRMIALWTNFVKYMNPTPKTDNLLQNIIWPKFTTSEELYLDIGSDMEIRKNPKANDLDFWEDIYGKYGSSPYDTY